MSQKEKQKKTQLRRAAVILAGGMTAVHPGIALMSSPYMVYAADVADMSESISEQLSEALIDLQLKLTQVLR